MKEVKANIKVTYSNAQVTLVMDHEAVNVVLLALEHCGYDTENQRRRDVAAQIAMGLRGAMLPTKTPAYRHKEG